MSEKVYVYEHQKKDDDLDLTEVPDLKEMIRRTMLVDLKRILVRKKVEKPTEPDTHDEWRKLNEEDDAG